MTMKIFILVLCIVNLTYAARFGNRGADGRDGSNGRSGRSSESITIYADQSLGQSFNLNGEPGENGSNAFSGSNASSCHFQKRAQNMYGARGGDGGRGGNAGAGGHGGDATIFYQKLSDLKSIRILARGARAGRAGYGAREGIGCRCRVNRWQIKKCRTNDEGERVCTTNTYRCYAGARGDQGRDGISKSAGSDGHLTIIKGDSIIRQQNKNDSLSLNMNNQKEILLTENIWLRKNGALGLLAPGSAVQNTYTQYSHRVEKFIHFNWISDQDIREFKDHQFNFSLKQGKVSAGPDKGIVGIYKLKQDNENAYLSVKELFKIKDLQNFVTIDRGGIGSKINVTVQNNFHAKDKVKTSYYVKVASKKTVGRTTVIRYEGLVPSELVTVDNDGRATISIGELPFSYKYKKKKRKLRITIIGINNYRGQEFKKEMDFYYKVGYSGSW